MNPKIDIYCDGSCLGNPGCGGWAALLVSCYMGKIYKKLIVGSEINATNNQMELTSVIEGFKALKKISNVNIYSDSKYVIEGMKKWITVWREKKFKKTRNKTVKNQKLWIILDKLSDKHKVNWLWVKSHSGHPQNEQVDNAAKEAAKKLQSCYILYNEI